MTSILFGSLSWDEVIKKFPNVIAFKELRKLCGGKRVKYLKNSVIKPHGWM